MLESPLDQEMRYAATRTINPVKAQTLSCLLP
jgi:hypothetical protein